MSWHRKLDFYEFGEPSKFLVIWFRISFVLSASMGIIFCILLTRSTEFSKNVEPTLVISILAPFLIRFFYGSIKRRFVDNKLGLPFGSEKPISNKFRFDIFISVELLIFLLLAAYSLSIAAEGQSSEDILIKLARELL